MSLLAAVEEVTCACKTGCRLVHDKREGTVVYVYDLHKWTHEQGALLLCLRPLAQTSIHSSAQSLSGFMIQVREVPPQRIELRLGVIGLLLAFLIGVQCWGSRLFQ
jgi:hypothetical protein